MSLCPTHSEPVTLYCKNCDAPLCLKCLDTHGALAHVLLDSDGASQIFREKLSDFHLKLKAKQESISHRIQELTEVNSHETGESFEEF